MFCAVDGCEDTATEPFMVGAPGHEQAAAMVCPNHDFTLPGWVLRTGIGTPVTLYPPDADVPPF